VQIILKENPNANNRLCLFDTRSNMFFYGGCVSNPKDTDLLNIANEIVLKTPRQIHNLVQDWEYGELGYTEPMIAKEYLKINPDLKEQALIPGSEKKVRQSRISKAEKVIDPDKPKGKRGRPRKIQSEATEGAEKSSTTRSKSGKMLMNVDSLGNEIKRGRGRPRKEAYAMTV